MLDYLYAEHRQAAFFTPDAAGADAVSARDAMLIAGQLRMALEDAALHTEQQRARAVRTLDWLAARFNVEAAVRAMRAHVRHDDAIPDRELSHARREMRRMFTNTLRVYDRLRRGGN